MKTSLINRSKVKQFTMEVAKQRTHRFTRISEEFLLKCDAHMKDFIRQYVHRHPSLGKTIQ